MYAFSGSPRALQLINFKKNIAGKRGGRKGKIAPPGEKMGNGA